MHELVSLGNKAPSKLLFVKYLTLYFHERKKGVPEIERISWTTGASISVILKNSLQLNCFSSRKLYFV